MHPYQDQTLDIETRIIDLMGRMTPEEKAALCSGCSTMEIGGIRRLGIPRIRMADGPQGIRLLQPCTADGHQSAAFPCGMALAASFDPATAEKFGRGIALDASAAEVQVSLGPGMNLMRTPLNGRNFEYYGEDPVLAGKIASGYVRGCQALRVAATPKHLALNNQEICRTIISSEIDERALRELYLAGFEIVAKEAEPWLMMSSYNRINGQYASECGFIQNMIVRGEWGFDGVMVSDWCAAHDTVNCAAGGLDLEMPGPEGQFAAKRLVEAEADGAVPAKVMDEKVRRILRLIFRTGVMDGAACPAAELGGREQRAIAAEAAAAGMVLLKNDSGFLPLDPEKVRRIVVIGPNADFRHHRGPLELQGGSGAVNSDREVTVLAGLREYGARRGIAVEYFPVLKFGHDTSCPPGLFGPEGVKCVYFREKADLAANADALFENTDRQGLWTFAGAGAQAAGGGMDNLPPEHFAVRMTMRLSASPAAAEMTFTGQHGELRVRVNGVVTVDLPSGGLLSGRHSFAPGEADGALVEIEYFSYYTDGARLALGWRETDSGECRREMERAVREADAVIFVGGTNHLYDREGLGGGNVPADIPDMELPEEQAEFIREIAALNARTAVLLINGSAVNVEPWIDDVPALLELWYPGEAGGSVAAEVLFGEVNPSGHLPFTWARRLEDYPCHASGDYPGNREDADPRVKYSEGIFIGYRHFDRAGIAPRFPFGFGLSYSEIRTELLGVEAVNDSTRRARVRCRVKVANLSERAGAGLVQIYVGQEDAPIPRPVKELKAFANVRLAPGEEKIVEFELLWRDFACWCPGDRRWKVPAGNYRISAGRDAATLFGSASITLREE